MLTSREIGCKSITTENEKEGHSLYHVKMGQFTKRI